MNDHLFEYMLKGNFQIIICPTKLQEIVYWKVNLMLF